MAPRKNLRLTASIAGWSNECHRDSPSISDSGPRGAQVHTGSKKDAPLVRLSGIGKYYGDLQVLHGIDPGLLSARWWSLSGLRAKASPRSADALTGRKQLTPTSSPSTACPCLRQVDVPSFKEPS